MDDVLQSQKNDSPAKQRRRPFTVASGSGTTHVYCTNHATEIATFYCARCQQPYGEDCVGTEVGEQTICINCIRQTLKDETGQRKRRARLRFWSIAVGLAATIGLLGFNTYILLHNAPTSAKVEAPPMDAQLSGLLECRHRLEAIAHQADEFRKTMQRQPEGLDEVSVLFEDKSQLLEPLSHKPYILKKARNGGIVVQCPNPEGHGLAGLSAVPGKPAMMEYKR